MKRLVKILLLGGESGKSTSSQADAHHPRADFDQRARGVRPTIYNVIKGRGRGAGPRRRGLEAAGTALLSGAPGRARGKGARPGSPATPPLASAAAGGRHPGGAAGLSPASQLTPRPGATARPRALGGGCRSHMVGLLSSWSRSPNLVPETGQGRRVTGLRPCQHGCEPEGVLSVLLPSGKAHQKSAWQSFSIAVFRPSVTSGRMWASLSSPST